MKTTVSIPGIHCPSCAALIKDVSADFPQIQNVDVNIDAKQATLEHDDNLDFQKWAEEIHTLGDSYTVKKIS